MKTKKKGKMMTEAKMIIDTTKKLGDMKGEDTKRERQSNFFKTAISFTLLSFLLILFLFQPPSKVFPNTHPEYIKKGDVSEDESKEEIDTAAVEEEGNEDDEEDEKNFDEEQTSKGFEIAGFLINGKIDINFESRDFNTNPLKGRFSLVNYHRFLFVSRREGNLFLSVLIPDLWFYEFGYRVGRFQIKGGKILVPIGADPLFHHEYGGLTGFDQQFIPFVWSEHGISLNFQAVRSRLFVLSGDIFVITAPKGDPTQLFLLTQPSQADKFALGGRLKIGYGKAIAFLSFYWNQYSGRYDLIMPSADISLSYGFLPFTPNIAVKMGFLRPYIEGAPPIGNYYHFANYLRLDIKLPEGFLFRLLTGTKTIQNYRGLYYDRERGDENDSTTFNFALFWKKYGFTTGIQYVINFEEIEVQNNFMRISMTYEF